MPRVSFRETAVVRLDSNGEGTARVGPLTGREVWYPSNVSIQTTFPGTATAPTNEADCDVFVGPTASPEFFRDTSAQASTGDATGACSADILRCGDYVWAKWRAGDADVQATLTVTGVKDV